MESHSHVYEMIGIFLFIVLLLLNIFQWSRLRKKNKNDTGINSSSHIDEMLHTMEAIQAGLWDFDLARDTIKLNDLNVWKAMLGHSFESNVISAGEFIKYIHPEDLPRLRIFTQDIRNSQGKGDQEVQFRLRRSDGEWHWVLSKGRTVEWNKDGTPSRISGIDINIQSLKEAERNLQQNELKFRTVFQNAPYPISIRNLKDGKYIEANRMFLDIHGISGEELIKFTPCDLNLLDKKYLQDLDNEIIKKGVVTNREIEVSGKDNNKIHVKFSGALMEIQGEKQILTIAENVTEQKKAEETLKESETHFRRLFKNAPVPMAHISLTGKILDLNDKLTQTMGHTTEKISTLEQAWDLAFSDAKLRDTVTRQWKAELESAIKNNNDMKPFECPLLYLDGSRHDIVISTKLIKDSIVVSFFDITDRKKAEAEREKLQEQLHQSQKLEAVGMLAGGIAHDFNNMLGSIMGYTELTLAGMKPDDPFRDNLQNILKATRKSADLTRQLLTFARKQNIHPVTLELNKSIESVLKMIRRIIGENIELDWKPDKSPCKIKMDPTQLDQILVNFCVNARDAIQDTGKITIKTDTVIFDHNNRLTDQNIKHGKYAMLAVTDNGSGMDKETIEHIFEPFYTTKAEGKGTGLGLATVYGIVKQNNGTINVFSELKKGTTFKIYIPAVSDSSNSDQKENNEAIPYGKGETVLIVEDDETVLSIAVMMLKRLGYNVLSAITPKEAIEIAEESETALQVLISDVVMPGMNGSDLAEKLKIKIPGIKIIFMSGYEDAVIASEGILKKGNNFIQKPFSISDIALTMRKVIDSAV